MANDIKKAGTTIMQHKACKDFGQPLAKCRECKEPTLARVAYCRFYAFRRLRYNKNGQLGLAGFFDPNRDPKDRDVRVWTPNRTDPPTNLELDTCKYILENISRQFCSLLSAEMSAMQENASKSE